MRGPALTGVHSEVGAWHGMTSLTLLSLPLPGQGEERRGERRARPPLTTDIASLGSLATRTYAVGEETVWWQRHPDHLLTHSDKHRCFHSPS